MRHFLSLPLKEIDQLLHCDPDSWSPHNKKEIMPYWTPNVPDNRPPPGYVFVDIPDCDDSQSGELNENVESAANQIVLRSSSRRKEMNTPSPAQPPTQPKQNKQVDILQKIKDVGGRKIMENIRAMFEPDDNEPCLHGTKKAFLVPFELTPFHKLNGQKVYTANGENEETDDLRYNAELDRYHPFKEHLYREMMLKSKCQSSKTKYIAQNFFLDEKIKYARKNKACPKKLFLAETNLWRKKMCWSSK